MAQPPTLLPRGFSDLLPPEAAAAQGAITAVMDTLARFGYARIRPPLAEFEDSLLAPGPGAALAGDTFRFMDPESHRMLGIRSDITPQIARIAAGRMEGDARPLRLAYAESALRTRGGERQITQVGAELIGRDDVAEAMVLALLSLRAAGVARRITLDVYLPGRAAVDSHEAREALAQRDRAAVARLAPECLPLLDAVGPLENFAELAPLHAELAEAMAAYDIADVALTVDPVEARASDYHEGIAFALFADGTRAELGHGGRYRLPGGEVGVGFTLYLERLRPLIPAPEHPEPVRVGGSWSEVRAAQEAQGPGGVVIRE